eukprot:935352-Pyramimonas_sp.AAC.1
MATRSPPLKLSGYRTVVATLVKRGCSSVAASAGAALRAAFVSPSGPSCVPALAAANWAWQ